MDEVVSTAKVKIVTEGDPSGIDKINAGLTEESAAIRKVSGATEAHTAVITEETVAIDKAAASMARLNAEQAASASAALDAQIKRAAASVGNNRPNIIDNSGLLAKGDFTGGEVKQIDYAAITAQRAEAAAAVAAADEKEIANKKRKLALEGELLLIEQAKKDLILASAAADRTKIELLRTEIAARSLTVAELETEVSTQAELAAIEEGQTAFLQESMGIIEERVAARKLELDTMAAQEALNVELIAQEEARLAAESEGAALAGINIGKARAEATVLARELATGGNTTRTFGALLGSLGPTIGIAGVAAYALYEVFKKYGEEVQKTVEAQVKLNYERGKEVEHLATISSMTELEKERTRIQEKIGELTSKPVTKEGKARDAIDSQINALEGQVTRLDRLDPQVFEREKKESDIKQDLKDQEATLTQIEKKYADLQRQADARKKTEEEMEAIKLGADIATINRAERDGKITHAQAEQARQNVQQAEEKRKFQREELQITDTIELAKSKAAELAEEADKKAAEAQSKTKSYIDAVVSRNDKERAEENAKNAAVDLETAKKARKDMYVPGFDQPDEAFTEVIAADKHIKELEIKAADLRKNADSMFSPSPSDLKQSDDLRKQADKSRDEVRKKANEAWDNANQVESEQAARLNEARKIYNYKTQADIPEHKDKINQATKKDNEEFGKKALKHPEDSEYALTTSKKATDVVGVRSDSTDAAALTSVRNAEQHLKDKVTPASYQELAKAHEEFAKTAVAKILNLEAENKKLAKFYAQMSAQLKNNTR